jgi:hypothetical protein
VQNFKKEVEGTAAKVAAVMSGDLAAMRALGAPLDLIGDVVRAAICAAPGNRLLVGDFSGIESVVLAWLAGDKNKIEQWAKYFRTKDPADDPYLILGIALGFPPETARKYGKIADLAFGYGGSIPAYRNFAPADDDTSDERILQYRNVWRQRHPQTVNFWYRLNDAAVEAVQCAPRAVQYGRLTLQCEQIAGGNFLFITLPSDRRISYPVARIIEKERINRYGEKIRYLAVTHMDNAENVGGWATVRGGEGMWPGQWAENITQGVARDLLAAAITRLEAAAYSVVLHVHDEIVVELPTGEGSLDEFQYLITQLPDWAAGMSIAAKVRNGPRFAEQLDVFVEHIEGTVDAPRWAPASKTRAQPATLAELLDTQSAPVSPSRAMLPASDVRLDSDDPFVRLVAWTVERERIRARKDSGAPQPWTERSWPQTGSATSAARTTPPRVGSPRTSSNHSAIMTTCGSRYWSHGAARTSPRRWRG